MFFVFINVKFQFCYTKWAFITFNRVLSFVSIHLAFFFLSIVSFRFVVLTLSLLHSPFDHFAMKKELTNFRSEPFFFCSFLFSFPPHTQHTRNAKQTAKKAQQMKEKQAKLVRLHHNFPSTKVVIVFFLSFSLSVLLDSQFHAFYEYPFHIFISFLPLNFMYKHLNLFLPQTHSTYVYFFQTCCCSFPT